MSQQLTFTKGHGTGNDFVIVEDISGSLDLSAEQIAGLCDRSFGIGGDGLLRIITAAAFREELAADSNPAEREITLEELDQQINAGAQWFMDYRNADGSLAQMCGNGMRVFAHYLNENELAAFSEQPIAIASRAGLKSVTSHELGYEVDLGAWQLETNPVTVQGRGTGAPRPALGVDLGNPHLVVALPNDAELYEKLDLSVIPQAVPTPIEGANYEFVVPQEPLIVDGVGQIAMRVFERGVGETLSCGTGAAAAALAVREWMGEDAPQVWDVTIPGGRLRVRMAHNHVYLAGPAKLVFSGELSLAS